MQKFENLLLLISVFSLMICLGAIIYNLFEQQ